MTMTSGARKRWQSEADRLANASIGRGDPTGWFEELAELTRPREGRG